MYFLFELSSSRPASSLSGIWAETSPDSKSWVITVIHVTPQDCVPCSLLWLHGILYFIHSRWRRKLCDLAHLTRANTSRLNELLKSCLMLLIAIRYVVSASYHPDVLSIRHLALRSMEQIVRSLPKPNTAVTFHSFARSGNDPPSAVSMQHSHLS